MRELELLIPARDLSVGMAAVDHGADAVYIGGPAFGARAAAGNSIGDIAELVGYAHRFRVKVYAALNTLVFEDELDEARKIACDLVGAGVDALIIQDPAYLMMGIEGAVFHASTQMCNTSVEKARFLAANGFSRVVLERGLTIEEIGRISREGGLETEVFVHGAICVGHSGMCYLSRSMGPRSGNRGGCSQPCRMTYDLEDQCGSKLLVGKHLLSVRDLDLSGRIGELIDAGVTSFKVEGRLKEAEYVKNITAHYRRLIDREIRERGDVRKSSDGECAPGFEPDPVKTFSRGYTVWTADGARRGEGSFDTPKAIGEKIGRVGRTGDGWFELSGGGSGACLVAGDGICFVSGGVLAGTNIIRVEAGRIYPNRMDGISPGLLINRNLDKAFTDTLRRAVGERRIRVGIAYAFNDIGLWAEVRDDRGTRVDAVLEGIAGPAGDPVRMKAVVEAQLAKTGGTQYVVGELDEVGVDDAVVPFFRVSELNAFRRGLLDALTVERQRVWDEEKAGYAAGINERINEFYRYGSEAISAGMNVTNSLSGRFWRERGAGEIDAAFDLRASLDGEVVMTTPYCLRRELGMCLLQDSPEYRGALFLRHGGFRYELLFDCANCLMMLKKC